ncbi:MAG: insulinase family protein [Magnetococcales bacterium]|nr:insulinase family protein [Magnetococcales bacterium]
MSIFFRLPAFLLIPFLLAVNPSSAVAAWSPKVSHFQGPGGMMVYHVESNANPLLVVKLLTRGGAGYDPKGKAGVASLVGWMFNEGGGDLDSEAFQEKLNYYGISLSGSAGRDAMTVSMSTLSMHLDIAWGMMMDALLRPKFAVADFDRAIAEQIAAIKQAKEKPDVQASNALAKAIYGDHPYGQPTSGDLTSLSAIKVADLEQFHDQAFRLPGMVLAVAGDISLPKLKELVKSSFAKFNHMPSSFSPIPFAFTKNKSDQQHIELDVPQTAIRIGGVGINRHDPDYYSLVVMNQILGGSGFTSRLTKEIREKRGLTYGVYSYFSPLAGQGPFVVAMQTKTESVAESITLLRQELTRISNEDVDAAELEDIKKYLTGSFPLNLDGLGKLAGIWGVIGFYQRGLDYLSMWPERIRAVTSGDIRRVARRILDANRLHFVTVGRTS